MGSGDVPVADFLLELLVVQRTLLTHLATQSTHNSIRSQCQWLRGSRRSKGTSNLLAELVEQSHGVLPGHIRRLHLL